MLIRLSVHFWIAAVRQGLGVYWKVSAAQLRCLSRQSLAQLAAAIAVCGPSARVSPFYFKRVIPYPGLL